MKIYQSWKRGKRNKRIGEELQNIINGSPLKELFEREQIKNIDMSDSNTEEKTLDNISFRFT